jgi:hypothetical protein
MRGALEASDGLVIVERSRHRIVFDVWKMPPKWAITLISVMTYDVPTLRICLPSIYPQTNTALDYQQWANMIGHMALDSRLASQYSFVTECTCEAGGPCCQTTLQLKVTNESASEELPVYSDDFVSDSTVAKVLPVHRTFSVRTMTFCEFQGQPALRAETDVPHTFDERDLVTVVDFTPPELRLPKQLKVIAVPSATTVVLIALPISNPNTLIDTLGQGIYRGQVTVHGTHEMVAHISKRQLLYYLAPKETVSISAVVRKGTGKTHINWSPIAGDCYYRPLFRDMFLNTEMTRNFTAEQRKEFADVCPMGVFDIEDDRVVIARPDECNACRRCERWAEEAKLPGLVVLPQKRLPDWQRFTVQTNGSLDASDVVLQGLRIMQERLVGRAESAGEQLLFPPLRKQ